MKKTSSLWIFLDRDEVAGGNLEKAVGEAALELDREPALSADECVFRNRKMKQDGTA